MAHAMPDARRLQTHPALIIPNDTAFNIMLKLERIINMGARRLCLYHPEDPSKCVKVAMHYKNRWQLDNELLGYKKTKDILRDFLPEYEEELVETNLGPGLVCELVRNDDGSIAAWLVDNLRSGHVSQEIVEQLRRYADIVISNNIPLYDPNPCNFLIQKKDGKERVVFSDMKSYNDYKPWVYLHLEKVIPALNRRILKRRLAKLFKRIDEVNNRK